MCEVTLVVLYKKLKPVHVQSYVIKEPNNAKSEIYTIRLPTGLPNIYDK